MLKDSVTRRRFSTIGIAVGICLLASFALAQRPPRKPPSNLPRVYDVPKNEEDLSGRFTFARARFEIGLSYAGMFGPFLGDDGVPWSHDYPIAGRHLMRIINELSKVDVTLDTNEPIFAFDDPDIFKYPFMYLCEIGIMELTDKEIAGLREYCLRGGFVMVDDFRGEQQLYVLRNHLQRAFPEYQVKKLDVSHPIFNCFFSIKSLELGPIYRGRGPMNPEFYGLEDESGRLMMVINYNYDMSDFWQWSDDPFSPIEETNESYKFGVNYIIYALTH